MAQMTQAELVRALAKSSQLSNRASREFLETLATIAIKEVKTNGVFVVPGLGRLVRAERKARVGRNPATGQTINIPARKVVKFRVAKAVKDAIKTAKTKKAAG